MCVCLSASISLELLDGFSRSLLHRYIVAVTGSSSGGVAICHVVPVLWMTSCLAVVDRMAMRGYSGVAIPDEEGVFGFYSSAG